MEEAKVLLFITEEVTSRSIKKGKRLHEAKRKREAEKETQSNKKRKQPAGIIEVTGEQEEEVQENEIIFEGDDDDVQPPVMLMYNSVRSYVSAIHELWAHQTSQGLHNAPRPNKVAIKALQTSLIRGEHARRREEYTDRGKGTMRDGYLQRQIPDLTTSSLVPGIWREGSGTIFSYTCGLSLWQYNASATE